MSGITTLKIAALTEIETTNGELTPEGLVEAATPPEHPLHDYFEWDDAKAGAKYRIDQARTLIRSVKVLTEVADLQIKSVYYLHDPSLKGGEQGYVPMLRLKTTDEVRREALSAEVGRARSALFRAHQIAQALELPDEAKKIAGLLSEIETGA